MTVSVSGAGPQLQWASLLYPYSVPPRKLGFPSKGLGRAAPIHRADERRPPAGPPSGSPTACPEHRPLPGLCPVTLKRVSERVFLTTRMAKEMVLIFILGSERGKPAWRATSLRAGPGGKQESQSTRPARHPPPGARRQVAHPHHASWEPLTPTTARGHFPQEPHWPPPCPLNTCPTRPGQGTVFLHLTPLASLLCDSLWNPVDSACQQGPHLLRR